jgi:hypothetical protein
VLTERSRCRIRTRGEELTQKPVKIDQSEAGEYLDQASKEEARRKARHVRAIVSALSNPNRWTTDTSSKVNLPLGG